MELTTQQQTTAFLLAFLMGAVICAGYIIVSVLRKLSPPGKTALFISDTIWMLSAAVINFLFAVSQTDGKIRFYVLTAELGSFLVIWFTVGKLLLKGTAWLQYVCGKTGRCVRTFLEAWCHKVFGKIVRMRERIKYFEKK